MNAPDAQPLSEPERFLLERQQAIPRMAANAKLQQAAETFLVESQREQYSYNFTWMGIPVIQYPQDLLAVQEIVWRVKPRAIVETGVARGGSLIFYSSLLQLVQPEGIVVGVDIDIRAHNREAITRHPLASRIRLIDGSSTDPGVVRQVFAAVGDRGPVMVCLDSNHLHEHVLQELRAYSPLVTAGSYLIVFDTLIEQLPPDCLFGRPWSKGNSPGTAVQAFLQTQDRFVVDDLVPQKLLITVASGGYLRCTKDAHR